MKENEQACEDCGEIVLSGDIRYVESNGKEVCEYCYDYYLEQGLGNE